MQGAELRGIYEWLSSSSRGLSDREVNSTFPDPANLDPFNHIKMSLAPPFTAETAHAKVKKAQDLWNTRYYPSTTSIASLMLAQNPRKGLPRLHRRLHLAQPRPLHQRAARNHRLPDRQMEEREELPFAQGTLRLHR
jgi:hypothetical protein